MKRVRNKYKFYSGVQQITPDTPDYSKAYELQATEGAKTQGIKNAASQFSGAYAPVGQLGGMASDVIKSHNKSKGGAQLGGAVSMGASGAALGMQLGGPWGAAIGAVGGGIYGAVTGGKEYEKGKKLQEKAELDARWANAKKSFKEGTITDAQSSLAKKGKYKLKSKQPREIETEGREPIFSPKKPDGTRDLLYYNPNDPTHEEGGVKAMVIPKAQKGKQKVKAKPKPVEEPYVPLEDNDSIVEEVGEIFDPTGISSWDDTYRSAHNFVNKKNRDISDYADLGLNVMGAIPIIGKVGKIGKLAKTAFNYADKGLDAYKLEKRAKQIKRASEIVSEKPKGNKFTQSVKRIARVGKFGADRAGDIQTGYNTGKDDLSTTIDKNYSPFKNPDWNRTHSLEDATLLGRKIFPKMSNENMYPLGAKQLKVNTLNDTALSNNLTGMPAANAANKFIQPMAGISQVARNIPEARRKTTIKKPMSHRKENPDTNRVITPPTRFDDRPKQPISGYDKGSKKVKVYR